MILFSGINDDNNQFSLVNSNGAHLSTLEKAHSCNLHNITIHNNKMKFVNPFQKAFLGGDLDKNLFTTKLFHHL